MATAAEIQTAYKAIYRTDLNVTVAQAIAASGISLDAYIAQQLPQVASTTQAAVAIASFVTGVTPTTAKLDSLKVEADAQVASYTKLGVGNPALGAYEAFGRSFATDTETTAAFNTKYGALSTADFIGVVYAQVYGTQPSAGAAANLTAQINYFTNLYTANGVANAALAAKGAVLGQIVGYAFTSTASANSNLDNQVQSVLTSAAKGDATVYAKALPTVVDPGTVGVTVTLAGTTTVSPSAADPAFKTTANNDTITGTLANATSIDGGAGADILQVKLGAAITDAAATKVTNVETLRVDGNGFDLNLKNFSGYTDLVSFKQTAAFSAQQIAVGTKLAIDSPTAGAFDNTFKFAAVAETVDLTVTKAVGGNVVFGSNATDGAKVVNVHAVGGNSTFTGFAFDDSTTTVKFDGTANLTLGTVTGAKVASVDASGVTGSVGLTFNAAVNATVGLTGGSDVFTTGLAATKNVGITTGAGSDTVILQGAAVATTLTNLSFNADNTVKTLATVDFTKGSDKIDLKIASLAADVVVLDAAQLQTVRSAGTLEAALATTATAIGTSKFALFDWAGDSYIYHNDGDAAVDPGDGLVKLVGATGLTIGTAATSDILVSA